MPLAVILLLAFLPALAFSLWITWVCWQQCECWGVDPDGATLPPGSLSGWRKAIDQFVG